MQENTQDYKELDLTIEQVKNEITNKKAELLFHEVSKQTHRVIVPSVRLTGASTVEAIIVMSEITDSQLEAKEKVLKGQLDLLEWNLTFKKDKNWAKNRKTYYKNEEKVRASKKNGSRDVKPK